MAHDVVLPPISDEAEHQECSVGSDSVFGDDAGQPVAPRQVSAAQQLSHKASRRERLQLVGPVPWEQSGRVGLACNFRNAPQAYPPLADMATRASAPTAKAAFIGAFISILVVKVELLTPSRVRVHGCRLWDSGPSCGPRLAEWAVARTGLHFAGAACE